MTIERLDQNSIPRWLRFTTKNNLNSCVPYTSSTICFKYSFVLTQFFSKFDLIFAQEKAFSKPDLDEICLQLAPDSNSWWNPHRSPIGLGNYDINVIMAALTITRVASSSLSMRGSTPGQAWPPRCDEP